MTEGSACFVGIDVAKRWLDWAMHGEGRVQRVGNDEVGLAELVEGLQALKPALVVLEASGGYELAGVRALQAAGLPVTVVNPRHVRDFARASGRFGQDRRH